MSTRSLAHLPPVPDFLAQIAESFGVEREAALILLGKLLVSYEPAPETACVDRRFSRPASVEAEKVGSFGAPLSTGASFVPSPQPSCGVAGDQQSLASDGKVGNRPSRAA